MTLPELQSSIVAVLLGGNSAEREISLQSGATIVEALESLGLSVRQVDPAQDDWIEQLSGVALAFNALHGPGGEDGVIQGALESLGIVYTGSGVLGSALAMDKQRSKFLWQGMGIPTAGFCVLQADSNWQSIIDRFGKVFVKPACEGSSIGMAVADSAKELQLAYENASHYGSGVLAEQFIDGPEYTVAVLGGQALPSIRMETPREFYDYEAKYFSNDTLYHCPSGLSDAQESELSRLARTAFESLGCRVWGRVDFMQDSGGKFYVLEVNTIPGMTSHSLVPMAAAAAGLDMQQLVLKIIEHSLEVPDGTL